MILNFIGLDKASSRIVLYREKQMWCMFTPSGQIPESLHEFGVS